MNIHIHTFYVNKLIKTSILTSSNICSAGIKLQMQKVPTQYQQGKKSYLK